MDSRLDHENLDVYRIALQFVEWGSDLFEDIVRTHGSRPAKATEILDHLDRATLSILFNTAEGNGRRQMRVRAKFFDDARGSGTECGACLDALVARKICPAARITSGKVLLVRIVSMLTKLVDRFTPGDEVREDPSLYEADPRVSRKRKRGEDR